MGQITGDPTGRPGPANRPRAGGHLGTRGSPSPPPRSPATGQAVPPGRVRGPGTALVVLILAAAMAVAFVGGGALADTSGRVVGITTAIATVGGGYIGQQTGSIGVGFAIPIPIATACRAATQLLTK